MAGFGDNTFGYLKWGLFGDENVNVTNPNDTLWGGDSYGSNFWSGGGNLNADIGPVSITSEVNAGWGSDTWGTETWGISGLNIQLTGIELTITLNSVTTKSDVDHFTATGQQVTATLSTGTVAGTQVIVSLSGQPMTMTLQYQEAVVDVTGIGMSMQEGDETPDANTIAQVSATSAATWNGNFAWGYGVWGNEQITTLAMSMNEGTVDPAPDANVTGIAMSANIGTLSLSGNANTGIITNIAWGEQTWGESSWGNGKYFDATGYAQAATITLGTAVGDANTIASITGQLMTMQEGDEGTTANARVNVTGNNLTFSAGTVYNLIWNEVNTGTTSTWTEVDTAA